MPPNPPPDPDRNDTTSKVKSYARYSGMAIQMAVLILLGAFGGRKLDEWAGTDRPYFTVLGSLLGIFAALYISLKDLFKTN